MLVAILAVCTILATFAFCRYLAVKVQIIERHMSELIARRLLDGAWTDELNNLREENALMRNLLRDIVENEASLASCHDVEERLRRQKSRTARRRELFGEAVVLLDHTAAPKIRMPQLS